MSSPLKENTTTIQELLNTINSLPEAGGVELPELSNPATAEEVFLNKEFIDEDGNSVTGTFTIDDELTTQDNLITQIVSTLQNKASATPTLQTKTVTPTTAIQNVTPDNGYDGLSKVTVNAMPTATQATPTVSIDSAGKITASATQTAGYVSAGTKTGTKQLTTQAAKTITPSTSSQTAVASGRYTTGAVTVAGDANLKAENIAEGVSIFGVTGTHSGGSGGGGSVVMSSGSITVDAPNMEDFTVYAVNGNLQVATTVLDAMSGGSFQAVKGTIIAIKPWTSMCFKSGCTAIIESYNCGVYIVDSDSFTLTYA